MNFLTRKMERSVSQANCNPVVCVLAMVAIVIGVVYHFRVAILNVIKDTVMVSAAVFLAYAAVHITGHIIRHRRRLAQNRKFDQREPDVEANACDPVQEAERLVSQAYQASSAGLPKTAPGA